MSPLPVSLKHGTRKHALVLDDQQLAELDGRWLKQRVQELTSVPADKVKVLVKGGQLKVGLLARSECSYARRAATMPPSALISQPSTS